jgi:uncharacterized membrane protein
MFPVMVDENPHIQWSVGQKIMGWLMVIIGVTWIFLSYYFSYKESL